MTISQAIEKAIEGGYHRGQIGTSPIVEINCDFAITETKGERNHYGLAWVWLDPLFWQSLYGSEKYGRIKAIEFINAIFDGKSAEKFFEQESDLGKEQQEKALS